MRIFINLVFAFTLLTSFAATSFAAEQISVEKKALIRELIDMTGGNDLNLMLAKQSAENVSEGFRISNKDISSTALDAIKTDALEVFQEEMSKEEYIQINYIVFDKYFSAEDLKEMVSFYKTPLGQKWLKTMPLLASDTTELNQKWMQSVMPKVLDRVKIHVDGNNKNSQIEKQ